MNILHRIVRKTLRLNPTRTLVTIIGIMLSMALTVAVLEGAYSGLKFMEGVEGETDGFYQGYWYGLDETKAKAAAAQDGIKHSVSWQTVGYAAVEPSEEDSRPYITVDALGADPNGLLAVRLTAGRMPQNETELLLPADWFADVTLTRGEIEDKMNAAIGQPLTLSLGTRQADNGDTLTDYDPYRFAEEAEGGETLVNTQERTYTVVGVYRDFDRFIEPVRYCYRMLTAGQGSGEYRVFFTLKLPILFNRFRNTQQISPNFVAHTSLLRYYGVSNQSLVTMLYGFAGVLVGLVAFGSISLIYNSFSISVSERTRQFGILKSVGATKKQIRAMVRYEAVTLGGLGVLLGAALGLLGIGITLWGISGGLAKMMNEDSTVRMRLVINPVMLLLSAAVCMVTTLISARIPANRAVRLNAIEAIRQSGDVRIRPREVKVSPITQKLFGFEGMMASKNFKRNRKRYRATVLSLFMSIVLFISASSLTDYLRGSINDLAGDSVAADVAVSYYAEEVDAETVYRQLSKTDGLTDGNYYVLEGVTARYRTADLTDDFKAFQDLDGTAEVYDGYTAVLFADDATFRTILQDNGLKEDDYFSGAPKGLILNERTERIRRDGKWVWKNLNLLDSKAFPATVLFRTEHIPEAYAPDTMLAWDGIVPDSVLADLGIRKNEVAFYDAEAFEKLNAPDENGNSILGTELLNYERNGTFDTSIFDREKLTIVPETELYTEQVLTIAAPCKTNRIILPDRSVILYPYSRLAETVDAETAAQIGKNMSFAFHAENHAAAAEALRETAEANRYIGLYVADLAENLEAERLIVRIVDVFAYGFIILISLIAVANVFNTISTNIMLRRREFAMLKSIGLGEKGFRKMLNYECIIYGLKGLLWGLPAAVLVTFLIWKIASGAVEQSFYIPWYSIAIAVGSVFAVVFATMLYAARKIKKDNPIDALKNENL